MNEDFKKNGIPTGEPGFQYVLDNEYLDSIRVDGRFKYRINEHGLARWNRLNIQFNNTVESVNTTITIGGDVTGSIVGSHDLEKVRINPTMHTTKNTPAKNAKTQSVIEKTAWLIGIFASIFVIWEFILKRWFHQP